MRFITTALYSEATAIIEHLGMEKVVDDRFKVFKNHDSYLIVSGMGSLNSAIATTYLLSEFKACKDDKVINIGLAGSSFECGKGDVFTVSKVIDYESKSILQLSGEKKLTTFNSPQNSKVVKNSLVDMEGYGFVKASHKFTKNVEILKVVSDFCEDRILSKDEAKSLMMKVLERLS